MKTPANSIPTWFKPSMVVLGGMVLLLLADAPRDAARSSWSSHLPDAMTLRLLGAVVVGLGVYWGILILQRGRKKRR